MASFNHLNVPDQYNQYFTKYPQGYTILEALLNWVQQVDDMVDNVNDWNTYLDGFVKSFDTELQTTVSNTLTDWQNSGLLQDIISQALQTEIDTVRTLTNQKADLTYVDQKFGAMGNTKTFKGTCTFAALPTTGQQVDDYWYVTDRTSNYCWNGTSWLDIGNALNIANNSVTSDKTTDNGHFGLLTYTSKPALFDFTAKTVTFYANTILAFKKNRYIIANGTDVVVDITAVGAGLTYALYYNKNTNALMLISTGNIATSVTEDYILIAVLDGTTKNVSTPSFITRDNHYYGILVSSKGYPNFDFVAKKITFYVNTLLLFDKTRYVIASGATDTVLDISAFTNTDQVGVYYNRFTNTFKMLTSAQISQGSASSSDILIASFNMQNSLVFMAGGFKVNGVPFGIQTVSVGGNTSSRFAGKTLNFLGNSITWGYSPVGDGSQLANPFPTLVGQALGAATVNNYGISGSTVADLGGGANSPFASRYSSMADNAELVFILGGTNDWAKNVPLGTITDSTINTYYGALNILISGILNKYPTQTIVLATPLHRQGDTVPNTVGATLNDYRKASLAIGEKYGIAVLDLYATSGFYPDNSTNYNAICPDGRHPNTAGHVKLANRIAGFLLTV